MSNVSRSSSPSFSHLYRCISGRSRHALISLVLLGCFAVVTWGQANLISTVAGGGPNNLAATQANLQPVAVALDGLGNYYIAVAGQNRVFRVSAGGTLNVAAGNGLPGLSGDGGDPAAARLNGPLGIALDSANNLYIADTGNNCVRKVTFGSTPSIATIAGNGTSGFSGDGGAPSAALLAGPAAVAVDNSGNVYIADQGNNRVRKITAGASPTISTLAGTGVAGFSGDGGSPGAAQLAAPAGVAVDSSGHVYIADQANNRIRKLTFGSSPVIATLAGTGTAGFGGDGASAAAAQLSGPAGIAVDSNGNLYIADQGNNRIRKVLSTSSPTIGTVAGNGIAAFGGDGGSATSASLSAPSGVAVDGSGNLYIADTQNDRVRFVTAAGVIQTVAGNGSLSFSGDGLNPQCGSLSGPVGVAVDASGNIYIADFINNRIREVVLSPTPTLVTIAGSGMAGFSGDGASPAGAQLAGPLGVALDPFGNLYIADSLNNRIRMVTAGANPTITTVVGNGTAGFSGDGGSPLSAQLSYPTGVAFDASGNLYIADSQNHRIRQVVFNATPTINTVAGNGTPGYSGDGGSPTSAGLNFPTSVVLDGAGNLYIADYGNQRIRKVTFGANPNISTLVGNGSSASTGAGGDPAVTPISNPFGIAVDAAGNLYISEIGNDRVREVLASTSSLITIAGDGTLAFTGDGGAATGASVGQPAGLVVDAGGNLYIASSAENRIRKITGAAPVAAPPTVSAGGNQTITLPATATLSGSAVPGAAGATLAIQWSAVSGPGTVTFGNPNTAVTTASFSAAGAYTLQLTATAGTLSASSNTVVTVQPANKAPTVSAGANQTITLPASATLNGSATPGTAGAALTLQWSMASGPGTVTFGSPTAAVSTASFSVAGSYTLQLTATSGTLSASSTTVVTVQPANKAPTVSAGANQTITLPASATLNGSATPGTSGATVTVKWSVVSGPGTVTFGSSTAAVTTASFSVAGSYTLQLTATSSSLSASGNTVVTVQPAVKPPVVSAGPNQTITLPASATLNGSATPGTSGATVTVKWSVVSGPGTVTFGSSTAAATTASFSVAGSYTLQLTATSGALSASSTTVITVQPAGKLPTVSAGSNESVTLPDSLRLRGSASAGTSGATVTVLWSVVSGPGTVVFSAPSSTTTNATFSLAGSYTLKLTATSQGLSASDTTVITVKAPAPTVNAGLNQTITLPATAKLTGTVTDLGILSSQITQKWTVSRQSNSGTVVFANPTALSTTVSFSAAGTYTLSLTASNGSQSSVDTVQIKVLP